MAESGGEPDLFRTARIGVLWNMDLCPISPVFSDATQIAPQIKLGLSNLGYEGDVHIGAIGDTRKLTPNILRDLLTSGIIVEHSGGDWNPNYKEVTAHLYDWPMHNPAPANIVYISTDDESVKDLLILGRKGFNIIKGIPKRPGVLRSYLWDLSDIVNAASQTIEEFVLRDLNASVGSNGDVNSPYKKGLFGPQTDYAAALICSWNWGVGYVGPSLSQTSSVKANLLRDSNGRECNIKPPDFQAAAKHSWDWNVGDVGPSLSQCSSVKPNLLRYSSGRADNDRDRKGKFGDYKGKQESNMLRDSSGRADNEQEPNLLRDSSGRADSGRPDNEQEPNLLPDSGGRRPKQREPHLLLPKFLSYF